MIEGTAVFREGSLPTQLAYRLACDHAWRTASGQVHGWRGERSVDISVVRSDEGTWALDGTTIPGLDGCVDLDLGFTPSTNLSQLRRIALAVGQASDVPVAWLDVSSSTLERLQQRYERRSHTTYWYEAPRFGYAALLDVDESGFVHRYPNLWEGETS